MLSSENEYEKHKEFFFWIFSEQNGLKAILFRKNSEKKLCFSYSFSELTMKCLLDAMIGTLDKVKIITKILWFSTEFIRDRDPGDGKAPTA